MSKRLLFPADLRPSPAPWRFKQFLDLSADSEAALIAGARDGEPVKGLTHGFYKYPARFSPKFARAAIEAFTRPGDLVLDNHVGGGTTLVEAVALGRNAAGVDISSLAEFVSTVKTRIYSGRELAILRRWATELPRFVNVHRPSMRFREYAELGYYKHLEDQSRWRLRKAVEQCIESAVELGSRKLTAFGRCVVLRTSQWALDGRANLPSVRQFREMLRVVAADMIEGARSFRERVPTPRPSVDILNRTSAGIELDERLLRLGPPRLVLTSPPYPGVHVLYHRWQVDGRKEAPLPFMIAGKLDGAGSSFYTMGDRKYPGLATYFVNIKETMSSVAALADDETTIVQMVAFADPSWQLPKYLEAMNEAGLREVFLASVIDQPGGRLWRHVPGRRWYSDQRGVTPGSQEVVLFHRKIV